MFFRENGPSGVQSMLPSMHAQSLHELFAVAEDVVNLRRWRSGLAHLVHRSMPTHGDRL